MNSRENLSATYFDSPIDVKPESETQHAEQVATRDREIYDRWVAGERVTSISEDFKLTKTTINKVVHKVESQLSRRFMEAHMQMRVRNSSRYENLYLRSMRAFEESAGTDISEVVTTTNSGENVTKTTKNSAGDPRYLKEAREALESIQKLWGLAAPERIQKEVSYHVDAIADDELVRRANAFRGVRERLTAGLAKIEGE